MGTNIMALIQTCQIQAIMTVPKRLSFSAQLSNCNLATSEAPNSPKTKMINGVLLQTLGTLLTACFREPRQVCLNYAGLCFWVVRGFRTVQIPLADRHWHFRA